MKVLHVYRSLATTLGGPAILVPALCRELSRQGCQATILTCNAGEQDGIAKTSQTKIVVAHFTNSELLSSLFGVYKELPSLVNSADIVHFHGLWWPMNWVVERWARKHKKVMLLSAHSCFQQWELNQSLPKQTKRWVAWQLYGRSLSKECRAIHATASNERDAIRATGLGTEVALIPIGIDISEFTNLPPKQIFDKYFPALSNYRILLFMSRIHPKKGLVNLAHAWSRVALQFPDWHLLIVGPDYANYRSEVEVILESYDIKGRYTFAGHLTGEARLAVYNAADLFVLPTFSENFGIVIGEALAAKVPVITTDQTPWEDIERHKCGWIIRPRENDLVEILAKALSLDKSVLDEMGERGRSFVKENYSWESVALKMKRLYRWILYGSKKPEFVHTLKGKKVVRLPFGKPRKVL